MTIADPRVRKSSFAFLGKILENTKDSNVGLGRSFSIAHEAGHEFYFLIDISDSISTADLRNMVEFCVKLIERVSNQNILLKIRSFFVNGFFIFQMALPWLLTIVFAIFFQIFSLFTYD